MISLNPKALAINNNINSRGDKKWFKITEFTWKRDLKD